jgi:hypothetical protein
MKIIHRPLLLILPMLLLIAACGGPIESFNFKSPDGDRSIDVTGKRESPAGPIIVSVKLNVPQGSETFSFEHQAGSLTKENVSATWINNGRCNLTFKHDDGTSWEVETFLLDDKVQAIKKFQIDGKSIFH